MTQETLPETILQFGGGKFLRAFVDMFVHQANEAGQAVGRVVVVQSTEGERARLLNAQGGRYHVAVRGLVDGVEIDRVEPVASIRRALIAQSEWAAVLEVARAETLRFVVSNTTEKGLALDPEDSPDAAPPRSFPAKLLAALRARQERGLSGLIVLPCELLDNNGDRLRDLIVEQARLWNATETLLTWLETECVWTNTLVDRIVTGTPKEHPLLAEDPLLIAAEPFALWAVETRTDTLRLFDHEAIVLTPDVMPYMLRKVRLLNGAHTALVCKALPRGFATVREAILDPEIGGWLRNLLFEEIAPTLEGRVIEPEAFARQTLERFANPFLEHKLSDIALYHEMKLRIRLLPTLAEYRQRFGKTPPLLAEILEGIQPL